MKSLSCGSRFQLSNPSLCLIAFLVVIGAGTPLVYAENFGIILDNTCLTMIRNNVTSNCPTYEDIITVFPDSSNQDVSGRLSYDSGIFQRGPAKLVNSFEYYRYWNGSLLFIDPSPETSKRIKLIEIKANLGEYLLRGKVQTYNKTDHSMTVGVGRYIDSCSYAYVDAKDWILYVGDSMHHMSNSCSKDSTQITSTKRTQLYKVEHDISTSYKWKLEAWQKEMINKCGHKVCIYEKGQPSPP